MDLKNKYDNNKLQMPIGGLSFNAILLMQNYIIQVDDENTYKNIKINVKNIHTIKSIFR